MNSIKIWQYPWLCFTILKLSVGWFSVAVVYYGVLLTEFPGGLLLNNFYFGVLTLIAGIITGKILESRYGYRSKLLAISFAFSGIMCILVAKVFESENRWGNMGIDVKLMFSLFYYSFADNYSDINTKKGHPLRAWCTGSQQLTFTIFPNGERVVFKPFKFFFLCTVSPKLFFSL